MTKPSPSDKPLQLPVILGMHSGDSLDVFIRDAGHHLHQAARITTRNGVDPVAMTAIMADLADAFGWQQIASATSAVPQARVLARGDRAAVGLLAAAREPEPKPKRGRPVGSKNAQPGPKPGSHRNGARRSKGDMQKQNDTIVDYLDQFGEADAVTTRDVISFVADTLALPTNKIESNVRHNLDRLLEDGAIQYRLDPHTVSGGKPRRRWYGTAPTVVLSTAEVVPLDAQAWSSAT